MRKTVAGLFASIGLLCASAGHAQWGGFLDPEIIREAGRAAASGDVGAFDDESSSNGALQSPPPTAREIANEMLRIEQEAVAHAEQRRREALGRKIAAHIEKSYAAEFGR